MRITNTTITKTYTNSLQKNLSLLNDFSNKVVSGRRFSSFADDPTSAAKAMKIRQDLYRNEIYQDNVKTLKGKFNTAHDAALQVKTYADSVNEKYIQAISDTCDQETRDALIIELEALMDGIISAINVTYGQSYVFGGTNVNGVPPFQYNATTGTVLYNGWDITSGDMDMLQQMLDDNAYMDIGLGFQLNSDGSVNSKSAYSSSLQGIRYLGYGEDNMILVLQDMINSVKASPIDHDYCGELKDKWTDVCMDNLSREITTVSSAVDYLTKTSDRLVEEAYNLTERQNAIEFIEADEALLDWKMQEYVYNAALSMGSRLLQASLFDYIR